MKKLTKLTAILLVISMLFCLPVSAQEENYLKKLPESMESMFFNMVFKDVVDMYQFEVEENEIYARTIQNMLLENPEMMDSFFRALFASFDDYSEFYTAEEFEDLMNSLEGKYGGIGVYIEKGANYVTITGVMPESPAEKGGLCAGDCILAIDGEDMTGKSLDYVSYRLRGDVDTTVLVSVLRGEETIEVYLTRMELSNRSVNYGLLSDDTAYLGIQGFASATAGEVREALDYIDAAGVKKIIIDLRDNGGGYVDSAIEIARMFVPQGTIITHYTKANGVSMDYKSYLKEQKYTLVTLVNENTASASEILASALQDSGASKLVGTRTFGKAVTQSVFTLYADRACKLTTGEYFTRNGAKINKIGLKPDVNAESCYTKMKNTDIEPLTYKTRFVPGETDDAISAYKRRLFELDYEIGETDDYYSETFKNAVFAYQMDNGIAATGTLDLITQIHITNMTDDLEVFIDEPLNKAAELIDSSYKGLSKK